MLSKLLLILFQHLFFDGRIFYGKIYCDMVLRQILFEKPRSYGLVISASIANTGKKFVF